MNGEKTLLLDIEASNLFSNIGTIICIGIFDPQNFKEPLIYFVRKPEEEIKALEWFEEKLAENNYFVLSGWNIKNYDIPFIHGRAVKLNFDFFNLTKLQIIDLLEIARAAVKIHSYKMEDVCRWLGIAYSPELRGYDVDEFYHRCLAGDAASEEKIKNRCKTDLVALARLFEKLKPYFNLRTTNKWAFS
jgi:uncharacterized protein YprB with RNaseH-like and TPR domain